MTDAALSAGEKPEILISLVGNETASDHGFHFDGIRQMTANFADGSAAFRG